MPSAPRRRPAKTDTERGETTLACARHLADLRRAHRHPPRDVASVSSGVPRRLYGPAPSSYCTSPAELCAEATR